MKQPPADDFDLDQQDGETCDPMVLEPETWLHLPSHRRMFAQRITSMEGVPELVLFYEDKEISFTEPELFGFGEGLCRQARFRAGDAVAWGKDLDWPRVQGLLVQLLDVGVLELDSEKSTDDHILGEDGVRPSPLPAAICQQPRSWTEAPELMRELTGTTLELGKLETVLPIFRVAHIAMDSEGRQVGEGSVFPPALRLDIATSWRTCTYPGTRYQDPKPMNVSALKSMRAHWGAIMVLVLAMRETYLRRFPQARNGWTVGHLQRLSATVQALPSYLLMRTREAVMNGQLHPALASLFKVTDGVRLTMQQMLFSPVGEPMRSPDTPMDAVGIWAYAERSFGLHSEHGVCAGPQAMIEEFLAVLIEGRSPRDGLPEHLDERLQEALRQVEPAMDYGLLGLQAFGTAFSLWPIMTRTYADLLQATEAAQGPRARAWRERFQAFVDQMNESSYLGTEALCRARERVYADMVAECGLGLGEPPEPTGPQQRLTPRPEQGHAAVESALLAAWSDLMDTGDADCAVRLTAVTLRFLQQAQAVLRAAAPIQARINLLLGRDQPQHPLSLDDLGLYGRLERLPGQAGEGLPFLPDKLAQWLHMSLRVQATGISCVPSPHPANP